MHERRRSLRKAKRCSSNLNSHPSTWRYKPSAHWTSSPTASMRHSPPGAVRAAGTCMTCQVSPPSCVRRRNPPTPTAQALLASTHTTSRRPLEALVVTRRHERPPSSETRARPRRAEAAERPPTSTCSAPTASTEMGLLLLSPYRTSQLSPPLAVPMMRVRAPWPDCPTESTSTPATSQQCSASPQATSVTRVYRPTPFTAMRRCTRQVRPPSSVTKTTPPLLSLPTAHPRVESANAMSPRKNNPCAGSTTLVRDHRAPPSLLPSTE